MTDAHCHVTGDDPSVREFLIGRDFIGVHPWECLGQATAVDGCRVLSELRAALEADPGLGVGEIGLDRLKQREISPRMREMFESQLELAIEFNRPVVLHGAKCWGQVVEAVRRLRQKVEVDNGTSSFLRQPQPPTSTFLFHGFSRSDGLIPDIVALGGFISVGPAVLNDHAVNYRELVKKIPLDRLLVETDRTPENAAECPSVREVAAKVAELRGMQPEELERIVDGNAEQFLGSCRQQAAPVENPTESPFMWYNT